MPSSGFYRLLQSLKQRVQNVVGKPRQATEKEADTMLGPNRDARAMMEKNDLRREMMNRGKK